jgi:hypothetical protein
MGAEHDGTWKAPQWNHARCCAATVEVAESYLAQLGAFLLQLSPGQLHNAIYQG